MVSCRVSLLLLCLQISTPTVQLVSGFDMTASAAVNKVKRGAVGTRTYNYFAYGSNMASSTMTAMRNLTPIASKAAILPKHRLAFNVPGTALVEPSWASVEPVTIDNDSGRGGSAHSAVHGVLYQLSEEDFDAVCRSEGVPFSYRLHRCRVVPYVGDGDDAGRSALDSQMRTAAIDAEDAGEGCIGVPAFTLRAGRKAWRDARTDIPPSQSYLNVLIRGAKEFSLDRDYLEKLEAYPAGRTVVGEGIAESMLKFAEFSKTLRRS